MKHDRAFDGLTLVSFTDRSSSVSSYDVAAYTRLDQEGVTSGVIRSEVEVSANGKVGEVSSISLHLNQIVDICIGQEWHLDRCLSSSLSQRALL